MLNFEQKVNVIKELELDSTCWRISLHRDYIEVCCDADIESMKKLAAIDGLELVLNKSCPRWLAGETTHNDILIKFIAYLDI